MHKASSIRKKKFQRKHISNIGYGDRTSAKIPAIATSSQIAGGSLQRYGNASGTSNVAACMAWEPV
jgi:hypothetical protein